MLHYNLPRYISFELEGRPHSFRHLSWVTVTRPLLHCYCFKCFNFVESLYFFYIFFVTKWVPCLEIFLYNFLFFSSCPPFFLSSLVYNYYSGNRTSYVPLHYCHLLQDNHFPQKKKTQSLLLNRLEKRMTVFAYIKINK